MITTINEFKQINEMLSDDDLILFYNTFMDFINDDIERLLSREGELPTNYFKAGLEERLNKITDNVRTVNDIRNLESEIRSVYKDLADGWAGLKTTGRY